MKYLDTKDPVSATVTIPVDAKYIGKQLSVYYSEDDITRSKLAGYTVQDDEKG